MTRSVRRWSRAALVMAMLVACAMGPSAAEAQRSGPANALQGFSQNRDQPVKIEAARLDVRDKDKVATFSGNVHMIQGDTTLRCATLLVYYEGDPVVAEDLTVGTATNSSGQQRIRRLVARGNVRVSQKGQIATGDTGVFDMRTNTVTLAGNVTVSRGTDVLRGGRLVVDLTNGVSRIEANGKGRVQGLFQPGREMAPKRR